MILEGNIIRVNTVEVDGEACILQTVEIDITVRCHAVR